VTFTDLVSQARKDLLDLPAVAGMADVSQRTLSSYLARGSMPEPDLRFGGHPVWHRTTIEAWCAQRRTVATWRQERKTR